MSQVVTLILDSKPTPVLCHMGDFGCGDGGWTPVMKIDGRKVLYLYFLFLFIFTLFCFNLHFKLKVAKNEGTCCRIGQNCAMYTLRGHQTGTCSKDM